MNIENVAVMNFERALRGMRNPKNSWERADTYFDEKGLPHPVPTPEDPGAPVSEAGLGQNDRKLALNLVKAGTDHRKFLRQIFISADLNLPRYVWQELDTYKVATVRNSCSTMHTLGHRDLTPEDFQDGDVFPEVLDRLNRAGRAYMAKEPFSVGDGPGTVLEGYDIVRWMKRHTPEGFLQMATYTFSYETALAILRSRGKHRLPEWREEICPWLRTLPLLAKFERAALEPVP